MLSVEKPINSRSEDFLDRKEFSDNIANAILNYDDVTNSSLTIGLYGKWGSGKTSIVNMIIEKLENENDTIVFKFEPWLFSDTQQLISNFFKELAKSIKYKDKSKKAINVGEELEAYSTFFKPMSLIPEPTISVLSLLSEKVFSGIGNAVKKWGNLKAKNLEDTKKSIEKHIPELNKKILIIIDDIDRLNNTEIRQVFQMIKVLGNFPNTIYLSSMDKEVIIDALSEVQKGDGSEYLEKIINVPFEVPSISKSDVEKFLFKKLDEIVKDINDDDFDKNYWANIYQSGYKLFFKNIRDVVRYINILKFNYSVLKNKVNIIDLIAITGFQVFEPKIFEIIKHNKNYFVGSFPEGRYGGNEEKGKVKQFIENSYGNLQILPDENYLQLLQELFVKINEAYSNTHYVGASAKCRKEAKLCSPEFFDTYFTMTLNSTEISSYEMKKYIAQTSDEDEFRETVLQLNRQDRITRFLERFQDFTQMDIPVENISNILDVFMDVGDSFPSANDGMFSLGNNMQIMRIFHQLLNRIEDKSIRYDLLKTAMEKSNNSINVMGQGISIYMQEQGEYEPNTKTENEYTITKESLSALKSIFTTKLEKFVTKNNLFEHKDALSILYLWLRLDTQKVKEFISIELSDNARLVNFLKIFISYSYSQVSGDYITRKNQKYNYDGISNFIDIEEIAHRVEKISLTIDDETEILTKYSIESFLNYYNGNVEEEKVYYAN